MIVYKTKPLQYGRNSLSVPQGSRLLCAKEQRGDILIWFSFNEAEQAEEIIDVVVLFTGAIFVPNEWEQLEHLDTVMMGSDDLVTHVFRVVPGPWINT